MSTSEFTVWMTLLATAPSHMDAMGIKKAFNPRRTELYYFHALAPIIPRRSGFRLDFDLDSALRAGKRTALPMDIF